MIELLLRSVLRSRPKSIRKFIAAFFNDPDLKEKVNNYLNVRKTNERQKEKESPSVTNRTDDLTKWRNVLRNNRACEKLTRRLEKNKIEEKRNVQSVKFVEYIKTQYFGSVCDLFLSRPQYTAGENSLLRKRVAEFLKKYFTNAEDVERLMEHYDVLFRERETQHVVKCVLDEMFEKLLTSEPAPTRSDVLCDTDTKVLYKVPDHWNSDVESL